MAGLGIYSSRSGRMMVCCTVTVLLSSLSITGNLWAQTAEKFHTQITLISEQSEIALGESFNVGLLLKMEKHWHTYWKDPGDAGLPTTVRWNLPSGFKADSIRWPKPKVIKTGPITTYGYEEEVLLLIRIHTPATGYHPGDKIKLEGEVSWQECKEVCILGSTSVSLSLPISKVSKEAPADIKVLFERYRAQIPPDDYHPSKEKTAVLPVKDVAATILQPGNQSSMTNSNRPQSLWMNMLLGFMGGIILNIMPCVLPIIAIKVLSFVKQSHDEPHRARQLGFIFALGVLVSFWTLAAVVLGFRTAGSQLGWGAQLNIPAVQMLLALIMTVVALNLFGVFEFELGKTTNQRAGELAGREGPAGAFFNGVLATTLATPCTAPFLAPALGFAFTQSASATIGVFTAIGLGFAFPYTLLAWEPRLLKWMPKPGIWMIYFKEAMGFPMIAVVLWLVWNLGVTTGNDAACLVLAWLLLVAFVIWLTSVLYSKRLGGVLFVLAIMTFLGYWKIHPMVKVLAAREVTSEVNPSGIAWQPYSKEALDAALKTTHPVFVDFESQACLTCKLNKPAFSDPRVSQRFKELEVIPLHAWWTQKPGESDEDWKKRDKMILEALQSFNRAGVPLYVIYPPDRNKPPIQLPDGWVHVQTILDALEQAMDKKN